MKTLKTLAMALLAATSILFVSCEKKTNETEADKNALNALITECQALIEAATPALYPQAAIDAFRAAIDAAIAVNKDDAKATQTTVDNTVTNLTNAKTIFLESAYEPIPENTLIVGMDFENVSGNSFVAQGFRNFTVLLSEDSVTTTLPTVVTGHNGNGLFFDNAAHLSIPSYTATDFEGSKLSIAVWVKPSATKSGNYILSYNQWNSWKFQIQEGNKPFFTVHTAADGWCDADNEADQSVPQDVWTHLVVTLDITTAGSEKLRLYVNGQLTKEWDVTGKEGLAASTIMPNSNGTPLLVGIRAIGSAFTSDNINDYFSGTMDNLKIYNIALTEGQVSGLYNSEK